MLVNPRSERVRAVRALSRRSARDRSGLFVAEGPRTVREAVRHRPDVVRELYVESASAESDRWRSIVAEAESLFLPVHLVDEAVLAAMADTHTPQGGLAVCRRLDVQLQEVLADSPRLICVLAHVRDPGNAGTVLRGADATGADAVIVTDASVDVFSPKVVRSTVGSLFHLPVVVGETLASLLPRLRAAGLATYAADGAGEVVVQEADLVRPHAWIFGNEAWGLPEESRQACDAVVRVPIYGATESLNLAMAATVCLYASAGAQHPRSGELT